ncbi:MAG: MATE family efflux transporter [Thermoplasmatota archaeon]
MVSSSLHISFNIVDTFWLGRLGSSEVGAPTAAWPVIFVFISAGMGLATAGVALVAQHMGAGRREKANEAAGQVFSFMIILSLAFTVGGFIGAPYILKWMQTPPDIYPLAVSYLRIVLLSMPFVFSYTGFRFLLKGMGDMVTPLLIKVIFVIVNIVLDPILIFGWSFFPALGVSGAAIATATSRVTAGLVGIYFLFNDRVDIRLSLRSLRLKFRWMRQIVTIAAPATFARVMTALAFVMLFSLVAIFGGTSVAAYGIGRRVIHVITIAIWGFADASMSIVGQNIGAGNKKRAEEVIKKAILVSSVIMFSTGAIVMIFRTGIMGFFIDEAPVIEEGARYLAIYSMSIGFFGIFRILDSSYRGTGHTLPAMSLEVFRIWGLRLFLSALLALPSLPLINFGFDLGVLGVWIGMALSNPIGALVSYLYFLTGKWKGKTIRYR